MTAPKKLDPSTFILRQANPTERLTCWRANSTSWAGKLTPDEYIDREKVNGSQDLTRDGGIRYWVFVAPRPATGGGGGDTEEQEEIYAAVETLKKQVAIKTRDGGFSIGWSYGIASVFTPPQYRSKKIAAWMMRRLGEWLDSEEVGCRFAVLYSDVGDYYDPLGWPSFPSLETSLPAATAPTSSSSFSSPSKATPLTAATLTDLCANDVSTLTSHMRTAPLLPETHTRFAFLPTYAQAAWHFGAEDFMASKLFTSPPRTPSIKGAIGPSGQMWGYWVHDFNEDKLVFLRLVSPESVGAFAEEDERVLEIAEVLRAAQAEAASWGLKKVVIWNPSPGTLAACKLVAADGKEVEVRRRTEGSIPCLRWKDGHRGGEVEKGVEWVALEKYSWC